MRTNHPAIRTHQALKVASDELPVDRVAILSSMPFGTQRAHGGSDGGIRKCCYVCTACVPHLWGTASTQQAISLQMEAPKKGIEDLAGSCRRRAAWRPRGSCKGFSSCVGRLGILGAPHPLGVYHFSRERTPSDFTKNSHSHSCSVSPPSSPTTSARDLEKERKRGRKRVPWRSQPPPRSRR